MSHWHFVLFEFCYICIMSHLNFVTIALCIICILLQLHFVSFAICYNCILWGLHFVCFWHFVTFAFCQICILLRIPHHQKKTQRRGTRKWYTQDWKFWWWEWIIVYLDNESASCFPLRTIFQFISNFITFIFALIFFLYIVSKCSFSSKPSWFFVSYV